MQINSRNFTSIASELEQKEIKYSIILSKSF